MWGSGDRSLDADHRLVRLTAETVQRLSLARTRTEIAEIVRYAARALAGADGATFVVREGDQVWYMDEEAIGPLWKGCRFPISSCISGLAILQRQPIVIPDIYTDARVPHDLYRPTFVRSMAMTPIRVAEPLGAIGVYWANLKQIGEEELEVLQALADSVSVALENVALVEGLRKANEQLAGALAEARSAVAVKDRFLARISHEIRTPLNGILGTLQLLDADPLRPEQKRLVLLGLHSGEHLMRLLSDLLDVARAEEGMLRLRAENCPLIPLLTQALAPFQARCEAKGLTWTVRLDPPLQRTAVVDAARIRQLLEILADNAVRFTAAGGVSVTATAEDLPVPMLHVAVSDTGPGMTPDYLRRAFERFSQADESDTRAHDGAGLGLALARHVVTAMGGTIDAESQVGVGTRFRVAIPLQPEARAEQPLRLHAALERLARSQRGRVLVVEDNPINLKIAVSLLKRLGHEAETAQDGRAALHRVREEEFDLILMDCQMPHLDGYEATRAIREMEGARRRTPIVALTASAEAQNRERCLQSGMDGFLSKPVSIAVLADTMAHYLPIV